MYELSFNLMVQYQIQLYILGRGGGVLQLVELMAGHQLYTINSKLLQSGYSNIKRRINIQLKVLKLFLMTSDRRRNTSPHSLNYHYLRK
jgi:hypothetical protein